MSLGGFAEKTFEVNSNKIYTLLFIKKNVNKIGRDKTK